MRKMFSCALALLLMCLMVGCDGTSLEQLSSSLKSSVTKQSQQSDTIKYQEYGAGTLSDAGNFYSPDVAQSAINSGDLRVLGSYSIDEKGIQKDLQSNQVISTNNTKLYNELKSLPKNTKQIISVGGSAGVYNIITVE